MKTKSPLLALVVLCSILAATPAVDGPFHFGLRQSAPAADAKVPAPEEVRLWFTQVPQESSVAIRVIDASGEAVETGEVASDPDDGKIVYVTIGPTLAAGAYTVSWRGIGDDGHVVRGDFAFSVTAQQ